MRIHFTFRNLESSDNIKSYASDKITRLQAHLRVPLEAAVTCSTERHLHRADLSITVDGRRYAAHHDSDNMYASIDLAMDKIDRQIRDAHAATTNKKRHSGDQLASGKNG